MLINELRDKIKEYDKKNYKVLLLNYIKGYPKQKKKIITLMNI